MQEQAQVPTGKFRYHSPVGPLDITLADGAVTRVDFEDETEATPPSLGPDDSIKLALDDYFRTGSGPQGVDIRLNVSPFQKVVLDGISTIPPGEVRSYAEVAAAIGRPRAARAVGNVLASNPVPIFVPCHRVVGSRGLGGYGGGLEKKRLLLDLEAREATGR